LCIGGERPDHYCAAEKCDEVAPSHCLPRGQGQCIVSTRGSTLKGAWLQSSRCPLWVKSRHLRCTPECPLYTRKRTFGR
jgi:hypothetical protein